MIRKIRMVNFRGFRNKTMDFKDKSVILLSAANGIGKTTTVDAIEWCLTGDIGRLKTAFDTRSTNETDRKMNTEGILKNRDAGTKESVKVELWLFDGEKEIVLCREQKKDELNSKSSKVMIDKNEERAKAFIQEYVGNSFYNFHFCDVQKSFNIQNKKRKDLEPFFSEFITNYDNQKQIAENLDIFADDVERYIEDKTKQKIPQETIELREEELRKAREDAKQLLYPEVIFFSGEKMEIGDEDLQKQVFNREVESLDKLNHKNIVRILDRGFDKGFQAYFIVLEYIQGQNFKDAFEDICRYEYAQKLELMEQVVEGIEYLHKKNIVHRDLKPSNLMIDKEGTVKIIDFGISRLQDTFYGDYTLAAFATKNYSSPEQMSGKTITYQSDIYSLGLIFYEIFTCTHITTRELMDVSMLPLGMQNILVKMTKDEPNLRYGTR